MNEECSAAEWNPVRIVAMALQEVYAYGFAVLKCVGAVCYALLQNAKAAHVVKCNETEDVINKVAF